MKSNREYWHDRQVEIFLLSERNAVKLHRELKDAYQRAADSLNDELAKLFARYGVKGQIQQHELLKQLSPKELGDWRMKIEEYVELIRKLEESGSAEAQALLLELNALSLRSRITRLEAMQAHVTGQLAYLAAIEEAKVHEHLKSEYTNTYYRLMYEGYKDKNPRVLALMQQHRVKIDPNAVAQALSLPWSGANYSTRIWRRQYQVANRVKELMAQHLLTGASVQRLTKMITDELGKDYKYAAERLIRTETAFVHGQADLKMYEDLGIEQYEFIATLDNKTSEICRSLDLKVFKLSEAVVGKNYPPMHPNCRSTTGMYDPEWQGTRLAKGEDGEYYKVPGDMNYEQWKDYVEENIPPYKSYGKFKTYPKHEVVQIAKDINDMLDGHVQIPSKWSGNIVFEKTDRMKPAGKLWSCDIRIAEINNKAKTSRHVLLHELLHARSASYYPSQVYSLNRKIEETTIQLFAREICKKENIPIVRSAYDSDVAILKNINKGIKFGSDYLFSKTLIEQPLPDRLNWLHNKIIDTAVKFNYSMTKLTELLDELDKLR